MHGEDEMAQGSALMPAKKQVPRLPSHSLYLRSE
jgi:hypothetical protein